MIALLIGIIVVSLGTRWTGTPGGYATDRSGALRGAEPAVPGTAGGPLGFFGAELVQIVGYVLMMVGLMLLL